MAPQPTVLAWTDENTAAYRNAVPLEDYPSSAPVYTLFAEGHTHAVSQQPTPQRNISVYEPSAGANRNVKNLPPFPNGKRNWSHGLLGCCDDLNTCALACCCLSCSYGSIKRRFDILQNDGNIDPEHGAGGFCGGDCCLHVCLSCMSLRWILQMRLRSRIRERYNIDGSDMSDCCTSCWCSTCDMTQQSRELLLEEDSFRVQVCNHNVTGGQGHDVHPSSPHPASP